MSIDDTLKNERSNVQQLEERIQVADIYLTSELNTLSQLAIARSNLVIAEAINILASRVR